MLSLSSFGSAASLGAVGGCAGDIGDASKDIAEASAQVVKMIADCKGSDRSACSGDVQSMLQSIDDAEQAIAQAAEDCGGQSAQCTAAVQKIGDAIGSCGPEAAKVAQACAPGQSAFVCIADSIMLAGDVAAVAAAIAQCAHDCKSVLLKQLWADESNLTQVVV